MGLVKEPKNVDLVVQSKPWTEDEVNELREIMKKSKAAKQQRTKTRSKKRSPKPANT